MSDEPRDDEKPPDAPNGLAMGPVATRIGIDLIERGCIVRVHFHGDARSWMALGPEEATQLGVLLIQHGQIAAMQQAQRKIVLPTAGSRVS